MTADFIMTITPGMGASLLCMVDESTIRPGDEFECYRKKRLDTMTTAEQEARDPLDRLEIIQAEDPKKIVWRIVV